MKFRVSSFVPTPPLAKQNHLLALRQDDAEAPGQLGTVVNHQNFVAARFADINPPDADPFFPNAVIVHNER